MTITRWELLDFRALEVVFNLERTHADIQWVCWSLITSTVRWRLCRSRWFTRKQARWG